MKFIDIQYYETAIGELIIGSLEGKLCLLDYRHRKARATVDKRIKNGLNAEFRELKTAFLDIVKQQLDEYLSADRQSFELPFLMVGTDFQKSVWTALLKVPYAATSTYLQLAKNINNEKAVRAVASANGANAMSIIIPCHRIIGSNGDLVGYAGGLEAKKRLLDIEKSVLHQQLL